jgi:hypothetical protein
LKNNVIHVTGRGDQSGFELSKIPHSQDNRLIDGGGCQPYVTAALYLQKDYMVLISVRQSINPKALVLLEKSGEVKKEFNEFIGYRTRNLS